MLHDSINEKYYFCRLVAKSQLSKKHRFFHSHYDNKERPYQAPTCLDHELAFIAANMAQVMPYDNVYDPFVGSASTLISAAHFNALTFGSDLDIRVILGFAVGRKSYNSELTSKVIEKAQEGS